MNNENDVGLLGNVVVLLIIGIFLFLFLFILGIFGISALYAKYNVWSSSQSGKAKLAEADYSRQIAVREALAKSDYICPY